MDHTRSTLLVRLRDRSDEQAWRTFDALYRTMLVGYARARGLPPADAEDVAQQCAEAVLEQIGQYTHAGSFKSWLRAIAEHKIVDRFRAQRREVQAESGVLSGAPDPAPAPATPHANKPHTHRDGVRTPGAGNHAPTPGDIPMRRPGGHAVPPLWRAATSRCGGRAR